MPSGTLVGGGDVGDGHPDDEAALVGLVVVGMGVDGVVVVAGVHRVDGHERQVAQVLAARKGRFDGGLGLGFGGFGEARRDTVAVDGDQRGRARVVLGPDHLQHLAGLGTIAAAVRADLGQDEVAFLELVGDARIPK